MANPWWYCPPKDPPEACPVRSEGFIPFSEYDAEFKFSLGSSRAPRKQASACCYGPDSGHVILPPCPEEAP